MCARQLRHCQYRLRELLLAGCAPCQPFSKQRRRRAPWKRAEATLLGQFARLVRELEPRVVLMENVPGIAAAPGFSSFAGFLKTLRDCGYECDRGVVNASSFGVPQHRRRYVLLAACGGQPKLPVPTEESGGAGTVRTAIDRDTLGFSDVYGRMWWDRVAPTLTSRCNSLSNGRFRSSGAGSRHQPEGSGGAPDVSRRLRIPRDPPPRRPMDRKRGARFARRGGGQSGDGGRELT